METSCEAPKGRYAAEVAYEARRREARKRDPEMVRDRDAALGDIDRKQQWGPNGLPAHLRTDEAAIREYARARAHKPACPSSSSGRRWRAGGYTIGLARMVGSAGCACRPTEGGSDGSEKGEGHAEQQGFGHSLSTAFCTV